MLAGPFAGMLLADQGARVIKIEPLGGESTRVVGPHPPGAVTPDRINDNQTASPMWTWSAAPRCPGPRAA